MDKLITYTLALLLSGASAHAAPLSAQAELIKRQSTEHLYHQETPEYVAPPVYPWDYPAIDAPAPITRAFFRCRGSICNPLRADYPDGGDPVSYQDCDGSGSHGLPSRDGKEFIYPILIELLNALQKRAGQELVITSGHRCPIHNSYADSSSYNRGSKHQIGAEVDFYIHGWEDKAEQIVQWIQDYYADSGPEFSQFLRYEKPDTNVRTSPWYNKEIFVKAFEADEGRDRDNLHSHPYLCIQVRWDRDRKERVFYSWDQAYRGYLRH